MTEERKLATSVLNILGQYVEPGWLTIESVRINMDGVWKRRLFLPTPLCAIYNTVTDINELHLAENLKSLWNKTQGCLI